MFIIQATAAIMRKKIEMLATGQCYNIDTKRKNCGDEITYQYFVENSKCDDKSDIKCSISDGKSR